MKGIRPFLSKVFKNQYFWLIGILLFAFLVRLYKINNPIADWHSWRQADTASVSRVYVQEGISFLYPRYHDVSSIQSGITNLKGYRFVEFPLYNVIHASLAKTFPQLSLEVWGRLVSIISSLISASLLFYLGRRFIGSWGGVFAAFYFAFIPYNIYFTRVILPGPMATAIALSSIASFVLYIDEDKNKHSYLYLSAILLAVSMLIKPYTVFYSIPIIYLVFRKHGFEGIFKNAKLFIKYLVFLDIALLPLLIWRIWINKFPQGIPFFKWTFNGDMIRFRPAFWRWIFGERLGKMILGVWGLIPFSFGLVFYKKKNYFIHAFLLGMFLYVSIFATANVRHDYYQIFIIPAVSLALAQGSAYLLKAKNSLITVPLLFFSILMMLGIGAYRIKDFYQVNHPEIIIAGQEVDKITPKDSLIIAPYNGDTAFLYQTNRWGWPAVDDSFENIIRKGADFYVSVNLNDSDTKYVENHFKVIKRTDKYMIADLHQPVK